MTVSNDKTLADVKHLDVGVVENGFIVTDASGHPCERGTRWVFANSSALERWMGGWGEAHHPVGDAIDADEGSSSKADSVGNCSLGNFNNGTAEQPKNQFREFEFKVSSGGRSWIFLSSYPDRNIDGLRYLRRENHPDAFYHVVDQSEDPVGEGWHIQGFTLLLPFLAAKYPGFLRGKDIADLATCLRP